MRCAVWPGLQRASSCRTGSPSGRFSTASFAWPRREVWSKTATLCSSTFNIHWHNLTIREWPGDNTRQLMDTNSHSCETSDSIWLRLCLEWGTRWASTWAFTDIVSFTGEEAWWTRTWKAGSLSCYGNRVRSAHPICDLLSLLDAHLALVVKVSHLALVVKVSHSHRTWRNPGGLTAPRYWQRGRWHEMTGNHIQTQWAVRCNYTTPKMTLEVIPSSVALPLFASSCFLCLSTLIKVRAQKSEWEQLDHAAGLAGGFSLGSPVWTTKSFAKRSLVSVKKLYLYTWGMRTIRSVTWTCISLFSSEWAYACETNLLSCLDVEWSVSFPRSGACAHGTNLPRRLPPKISCTAPCSGKIIWRIGKDRQVVMEAASYTQGSRTVWYHVNRHVFYFHAGKDCYIS